MTDQPSDQTPDDASDQAPDGPATAPANQADQPQLLLRILEGPHRGTRAPVREGFTIGRKEGDLILKDTKLSVKHARIEWRDSEWLMVDLGSSNKIKVDGGRYQEVVLYPGLKFMVGSTTIEVLEKPQVAPATKTKDFEFTSSVEVAVDTLTWREILSALITKVQTLPNRSPGGAIRPFPTVLKLEFISGVQTGTTWHIGYGPREIGARSFDLPLLDEAAQDSSFFLDTSAGKVTFRPAPSSNVRLNGQPAPQEAIPLHSGDRIEIGKTRIRVLLDN